MNRHLLTGAALAASLALGGCTSEFEKYDAALCACKDAACVEQVDKAIGARFAGDAPEKLLRSLSERDLAALDHAHQCREKLKAP